MRASREQERDRIRGGRVITLATLTRRRPDSRSRSARPTRLRLTYTPTLGLPLHLVLPSPSPFPLPTSPFTPAISSSNSYFSSFSSSSFPPLGPRLFLLLLSCCSTSSSSTFLSSSCSSSSSPCAVHPSSLLDRRTRKHQRWRDRTLLQSPARASTEEVADGGGGTISMKPLLRASPSIARMRLPVFVFANVLLPAHATMDAFVPNGERGFPRHRTISRR